MPADLDKWFDPAYAAHLLEGLRKAGLEIAEEIDAAAPAAEGS